MYGILCLHDRLSEVWSSGTLCLYRILLRHCLNDPLLLFWSRQAAEPLQNPWVCIFTFLQTMIDFLQWMAVRYSHKFSLSYLQTARTWQASKYLLCPFKTSLSIGLFSSQTRQVNARSRGIHMESNTSFEELLRRVESGAYLLGLLVAKVLFTCFGSWTLDTMCYLHLFFFFFPGSFSSPVLESTLVDSDELPVWDSQS